jgi:hypothetical protein
LQRKRWVSTLKEALLFICQITKDGVGLPTKKKAIKLYALSSKKDLKCQGNLTKDVNN